MLYSDQESNIVGGHTTDNSAWRTDGTPGQVAFVGKNRRGGNGEVYFDFRKVITGISNASVNYVKPFSGDTMFLCEV